jgi:hypothetical protein
MQILCLFLVHFGYCVSTPATGLELGKRLPLAEQVITQSKKAATKVFNSLKGDAFESKISSSITQISSEIDGKMAGVSKVVGDINSLDANIAKVWKNNHIDPAELKVVTGRKRALSRTTNDQKPSQKPKLEQKSFMTNYNKNFDTQGRVPSCHIFATLEVIHDVTGGLKLSKERLFFNHLISLRSSKFKSIKDAVEHNFQEIFNARYGGKSKKCAKLGAWQGGNFLEIIVGVFALNFEKLKTYGGIVVPHNGDWKEVERIMMNIKEIQQNAINDINFDPRQEREKLWSAITPIFIRGRHRPSEIFDRKLVMDSLENFEPEIFYFHDHTKEKLLENTYRLIKIIEKSGTAYLSMNSDRLYRAVDNGKKLTWGLKKPFSSNHAVALVGYSVEKDKFFIKDSNIPHLLEISPKEMFLSLKTATVLVRKGSSKAKL